MKKVNFSLFVLTLSICGCAATDIYKNPSGSYSPSIVLNNKTVGKLWSDGFIENKIFTTSLPLPIKFGYEVYLIGYKNQSLKEDAIEKLSIFRGLELARSKGYSCMIITPEKNLHSNSKMEFNSDNSSISSSSTLIGESIQTYGTISRSRGSVYYYNSHRYVIPDCKKSESDMPGKSKCEYLPQIDHPSYYAIYPTECQAVNGIEIVKTNINASNKKNDYNVIDVDKKYPEYEELKNKLIIN